MKKLVLYLYNVKQLYVDSQEKYFYLYLFFFILGWIGKNKICQKRLVFICKYIFNKDNAENFTNDFHQVIIKNSFT